MQNYNGSTAYDLTLFETKKANAQPKPQSQKRQPHVVKPKKKTQQQLRAEARLSIRQSIKILAISGILLTVVGFMIYGRVQLTELSHEYTTVQKQLTIAQSEKTRLSMQLNSMVSLDKVEDYASKNLGMVKQQRSQVEYVDLSSGDKVVLSESQKSSAPGSKIGAKIKNIVEYIF